ncbi:MAG: 3-hydroxyacyl-CoA dehydrogenase NAD-binding domain-containing protein [Holosporales bacterium]
MADIKKAAVIGSGVMGSAIAAHLANAGIQVYLLDLPQSGWGKKNALAEGAIERMLKSEPAAFMHESCAKRVIPGNTEDDLEKLSECDWIIEAIVEKLEVKHELYAKLEQVRAPHALISSNTSTIPLHQLITGRSEAFKRHFMITHFFNPPRYMRLLEVVVGPETDAAAAERLRGIADVKLGKGVVECHDTPGFIANRIGTFWLQLAAQEAIAQKMTVEEVDALFSKPMGIPKTGVFALIDLVGLDLMPLIATSLRTHLPADDRYCQIYKDMPLAEKMIADGYTGRKGKGGFYRVNKENGGKVKESINLQTGEYAPSVKPRLGCLDEAKNLRNFVNFPDRGGAYAWRVLSEVLCYAASLVPEITKDIVGVDTAMRLGYNWKHGPFELLDKLGPQWVADKLRSEGRPVPSLLEKVGAGSFYRTNDAGVLQYFDLDGSYKDVVRPAGVLLLSDIKRKSKPLIKNGSASLWDIGDGVVCFEIHTKMNAIDQDVFAALEQSIELTEKNYKAMVVHNEGSHFSAGANLGLALFAANVGAFHMIDELVVKGQEVYNKLKYSSFPVVGAPSGMALGGGCEILLHCNAIQAHAETYMGLVEVGVGLIPAWGGCTEMLGRWLNEAKRPGGAMVAIGKVFEMIATAKVAKSAMEAKDMYFLRPDDAITMNRDRLLADAKAQALRMVDGFKAPEPHSLRLPGGVAKVAMQMAVKGFVKVGKATPYDEEVAKKLSHILSGGDDSDVTEAMGEQGVLTLEREAFAALVRNPKTLARMEHILMTGKPLRN